VLVIAPAAAIISDGEPSAYETPYGTADVRLQQLGAWRAAWVAASVSPFAAIYAARAAGATRVVELAPVAARNRLLERGDLLMPDDLVDRTRLARYTFFAGKGYGFLAQREPFCPALRGTLLAASHRARVFARGVYLAAEQDGCASEPIWDAHVVGGGVVPASFLARELELCYATLCVVTEQPSAPRSVALEGADAQWLADMLAGALAALPVERTCVCATAMQQYRDRGDIGPDWRTWVAV